MGNDVPGGTLEPGRHDYNYVIVQKGNQQTVSSCVNKRIN